MVLGDEGKNVVRFFFPLHMLECLRITVMWIVSLKLPDVVYGWYSGKS